MIAILEILTYCLAISTFYLEILKQLSRNFDLLSANFDLLSRNFEIIFFHMAGMSHRTHSCAKRRHLTYWSWKSVLGASLFGVARTQKKLAESLCRAYSPAGEKAGREAGSKYPLSDRNDILHRCRCPRHHYPCQIVWPSVQGFWKQRGSNFPVFYPSTFFVVLKTLWHYCASVWFITIAWKFPEHFRYFQGGHDPPWFFSMVGACLSCSPTFRRPWSTLTTFVLHSSCFGPYRNTGGLNSSGVENLGQISHFLPR